MASWEKGIDLLLRIVDEPWQQGVRGLSRSTGMSKTAVHRLVREWEALGLVARTADGSFGMGAQLIRLAAKVMSGLPTRVYALPHLKRLAEKFNETVYLNIYDPVSHKVIPVEVVETTHRVRYIVDVGQPLDSVYGGAGKPVLAYLPEEHVRLIIDQGGLAALTPATITNEAELRADLAEIRRRGYAISYGERTFDVVAFGTAVLDSTEGVVGCISLSIPKVRFQPGSEATYGEAVHQAALAVSQALGYGGSLQSD